MLEQGCQYGEEAIILPFFGSKRNGMVVDVGAADGIAFSNSRFLIADYDWRGILIEPEPMQFAALNAIYAGSPTVRAVEAAAGLSDGEADLYPWELGSTLSPMWRDRFPANTFSDPVKVRTRTLARLLHEAGCPFDIDFLTIDCEGMDFDVLKSMDWTYNVRLICVESGWPGEPSVPMGDYLAERGFAYHANTAGNTFWRNTR